MSKEIKCPYCRESHCMELSSIQTVGYYPPIYKDGINVNRDKNVVTTKYCCLSCLKNFEVKK